MSKYNFKYITEPKITVEASEIDKAINKYIVDNNIPVQKPYNTAVDAMGLDPEIDVHHTLDMGDVFKKQDEEDPFRLTQSEIDAIHKGWFNFYDLIRVLVINDYIPEGVYTITHKANY